MEEKLMTHSFGFVQYKKHLLCFAVVLVLFAVGCQEKLLDDESSTGATESAAAETAVPPEATAAREEANPEIEGKITVVSQSRVAVSAVATADFAAAHIESLPEDIGLVGDVFAIDAGDTAVTGHVALNTPPNADVTLLDVYGWDGSSWVFVPSEYDPTTQQRRSADHILFQAVALGEAKPPDPMTIAGIWRDEADVAAASEQFTEAIVTTLYLAADGEMTGSLLDVPAELANPYLHLTNVGDEIDTATLSAFLDDEALQAAQIEAIVEVVEPYVGVNLNYQGIGEGQREAFTVFVQTLANALEAEAKSLILTLPAPQAADELSDLAGYDWSTLGTIADTVYLQLPHDPYAYEAGGTVDQLLTFATDNIDRRKLVALIPANPVTQLGETWIPLAAEEQRAHFGEIQFLGDSEEFETEMPVEVALSGAASSIQWDEAAYAFYYTVEDAQKVWLIHPDTAAYRMETAVKHNLQGVAFSTPLDFGQTDAPAIVWTILDNEGNIVVTESSDEPTFRWEDPTESGDFTLQVDFVSSDVTTSLGTLPIAIVAADGAEVVTDSDEADRVIGTVKRNANVRVGPGESYDKFPGPLLTDTEVEIIGRDAFGYWLHIAFSNIDGEQTGWIATSLLNVDPAIDISELEDQSDVVAAVPNNTAVQAPAVPTASTTPVPGSAPPPPVSAPPVAVGGFELGGQTHSFSNPPLMASAGMTWVKFQHKWGPGGNPNDLAGRINNAHAAGFKVLLSIPGANTYPESINFGEYVQFLAGVAALGPDAIEVWNEMNIDFEWPAGQIDPNSYVNNMLAPAYNAIKGANPNVMVISGAPAPTGFDNNTNAWADNRYMAGMLAAGAASYADCIGAHYNAGASSPSTVSGHPTGSAHYSWYLLPTLNVYAQLGKPVCFTELGYLSGEDYGGVPERFGWAAGTTVAQHAAWLAEAVSVAANTGKVRMIIVFNVDFTHWGDDPQAGYAMIRQNGGCPSCETLARVMGR